MELRQLGYFAAVAEELHFARAAAKLHVAQPSISQQIKALELELGVRLFERTSKGVTLTHSGAELLPMALQLLADAKQLEQVADRSRRRATGELRIGFLADEYSRPRAEKLLASIRRHHRGLVLEFRQVDFAEHHRALESGEVDVAFVVGPEPASIVTRDLFQWPRLVAVSRAAAATHAEGVGTWLAQEPIALPNQMASQAWRRAWTPPAATSDQIYVVGADSMEGMLAVVGAGHAVCVVPEYVQRFYPHPGVTFASVDNLDPCTVGIGALRTRLAEPNIAAVLSLADAIVATAARRRAPTAGTTPGA